MPAAEMMRSTALSSETSTVLKAMRDMKVSNEKRIQVISLGRGGRGPIGLVKPGEGLLLDAAAQAATPLDPALVDLVIAAAVQAGMESLSRWVAESILTQLTGVGALRPARRSGELLRTTAYLGSRLESGRGMSDVDVSQALKYDMTGRGLSGCSIKGDHRKTSHGL